MVGTHQASRHRDADQRHSDYERERDHRAGTEQRRLHVEQAQGRQKRPCPPAATGQDQHQDAGRQEEVGDREQQVLVRRDFGKEAPGAGPKAQRTEEDARNP